MWPPQVVATPKTQNERFETGSGVQIRANLEIQARYVFQPFFGLMLKIDILTALCCGVTLVCLRKLHGSVLKPGVCLPFLEIRIDVKCFQGLLAAVCTQGTHMLYMDWYGCSFI